jgi:hypothetical protein
VCTHGDLDAKFARFLESLVGPIFERISLTDYALRRREGLQAEEEIEHADEQN